ncbi:hypothetical protein CBL_11417 [Carabus blaptoides fortunei]
MATPLKRELALCARSTLSHKSYQGANRETLAAIGTGAIPESQSIFYSPTLFVLDICEVIFWIHTSGVSRILIKVYLLSAGEISSCICGCERVLPVRLNQCRPVAFNSVELPSSCTFLTFTTFICGLRQSCDLANCNSVSPDRITFICSSTYAFVLSAQFVVHCTYVCEHTRQTGGTFPRISGISPSEYCV